MAFFNDTVDHLLPQQDTCSLETTIGIEIAGGRVEDDIVTPVEPALLKGQGSGSSDGYACRVWQIELLTQPSKGQVGVTQTVQEDQEVGGRLAIWS